MLSIGIIFTNFYFFFRSDQDTLMHLLKASLGTGILAMPVAFTYTGFMGGILLTILTALICTHCAYVLVSTYECFFLIFKQILISHLLCRSNALTHYTEERDAQR